LKRPTPSFTVEIRRRPGRAASPGANFTLFEAKAPRPEFDRDTDRAIAAIFGPKSTVAAPVAAPPPPVSTGRVLTSLVVDRPLDEELETRLAPTAQAPEAEAFERPAPRTRAKASPRSKSRPEPTAKAEDRPPLIAVANAPQPLADEDAGVAPEEWIWPAGPMVETISPKTAIAKPNKSNSGNAGLDSRPAKPLPDNRDSSPAIGAAPTPPSAGSEVAAGARKRTIMGRYVYGDEPKPGERWRRKFRNKH